MKSRMILTVLMTLALVASSVAVGYAGSGGGSPITATLFDCYTIHNGTDSPYVLELTDRFGHFQNVTLARSRMLCTPTSAAIVTRGPVLNSAFDPNAADHIKCYDVIGNNPAAPRGALKIIDPLSTETVAFDPVPMVCTPAVTDPPLQ